MLGKNDEHRAYPLSKEEIEALCEKLNDEHQLNRIEDRVERIWNLLKPKPIVSMTLQFAPTTQEKGGLMATAYQLTAPANAALSFQDASGKTVAAPPTGSAIVWASSDTTFATVTPATDAFGGLSAVVAPVDTTGKTPGSSVISATLTQPDGTIVVISGTVADTDDVTVGTMTFSPATS
jgi:hypothetical protein